MKPRNALRVAGRPMQIRAQATATDVRKAYFDEIIRTGGECDGEEELALLRSVCWPPLTVTHLTLWAPPTLAAQAHGCEEC